MDSYLNQQLNNRAPRNANLDNKNTETATGLPPRVRDKSPAEINKMSGGTPTPGQ